MTREQAEAKAQKVVTAAMGHRNPKLEAFVSDALMEAAQLKPSELAMKQDIKELTTERDYWKAKAEALEKTK